MYSAVIDQRSQGKNADWTIRSASNIFKSLACQKPVNLFGTQVKHQTFWLENIRGAKYLYPLFYIGLVATAVLHLGADVQELSFTKCFLSQGKNLLVFEFNVLLVAIDQLINQQRELLNPGAV